MGRKKFTLILGATLMAALGVTLIAQAAVDTGIVGWWRFNEYSGITANDSSGFNNNGTLVSTAFFTPDSTRGNVLLINGTAGEVQYPFTTKLQPAVGTISVWVKPTIAKLADLIRQPTDMLVRSNRAGDWYAYALRVTDKGAVVAIVTNDDPKYAAKQPQTVMYSSSGLVKPNQWSHLVMRWDGSAVSLFVNGKGSGSARYAATPNLGLSYHGTAPVKVGAALWDSKDGYLEFFGMISDLRIFNRVITDTEAKSIFADQ